VCVSCLHRYGIVFLWDHDCDCNGVHVYPTVSAGNNYIRILNILSNKGGTDGLVNGELVSFLVCFLVVKQLHLGGGLCLLQRIVTSWLFVKRCSKQSEFHTFWQKDDVFTLKCKLYL